jgi:hypothetical protein
MKILVAAFCSALFVFALASAWSDMLQPQLAIMAHQEIPPGTISGKARSSKSIPRSVADPADSQRQATTAPSRDLAELPRKTASRQGESVAMAEPSEVDAAELRSKLAEVKDRERQLSVRQETLRLICDDIHAELAAVDHMHQQANEAFMAAEQRVVTVAQREDPAPASQRSTGVARRASTVRDFSEAAGPVTESSTVRTTVLMIRGLVSHGSDDTAISFLGRLKQREAAKILTAISKDDPKLAERLMSSLQEAKHREFRHGADPDNELTR